MCGEESAQGKCEICFDELDEHAQYGMCSRCRDAGKKDKPTIERMGKMDEQKRMIEINGVKLEMDLREAKQINSYKIGDSIKVLIKKYGDDYQSCPGVIVGFDDFKDLPTIIISYLLVEYNGSQVKFAYLTEKTKDIQICPMYRKEDFVIDKTRTVEILDQEIARKALELEDAKSKKKYFLENFNKFLDISPETFSKLLNS